MHPEYNRARRQARAGAIIKALARVPGVTFVDAAQYSHGTGFVAVATRDGVLHHASSVTTPTAETAEEVAIALATLDPTCHTIVCDSRSAVTNFSKGRISPQALRILRQAPHSKESMISLTWIPAHAGTVHPHLPNLNEVTHSIARGLVNRAGDTGDELDTRDNLTTYNDLVKAFYLSRRTFPPPHPKFSRAQATTLRLLQTNTYPSPARLHRIFPEVYNTPNCRCCGTHPATLPHMLWECPAQYTHINTTTLSSRLREALRSSALDDQTWATQHAREAAARQALDVPSWEA